MKSSNTSRKTIFHILKLLEEKRLTTGTPLESLLADQDMKTYATTRINTALCESWRNINPNQLQTDLAWAIEPSLYIERVENIFLNYEEVHSTISANKDIIQLVKSFLIDTDNTELKNKIAQKIESLEDNNQSDKLGELLKTSAKSIEYARILAITTSNINRLENSKRGKLKPENPTKQPTIARACEIWATNPRLSLDSMAERLKKENIPNVGHACIKSWIAPHNPKRITNK